MTNHRDWTGALLVAALPLGACGSPRSQPIFTSQDLAVVRDLAPRDFASPKEDLAQAVGDPDLAMTPPADMAMSPPDLAVKPDLAMTPADLSAIPADMTMAPADLAAIPSDLAKAPSDMAMTPLDLLGVPWCNLLVNEVQVGTTQTASEEFVEFYNPCNFDVPLTGWTMVYRSAGNANAPDATGDNTTKSFPQNAVIKGRSYYVQCTTLFTGLCDTTYGMVGIMATPGGGVGIRDPNGVLTDSVGYGTATNPFVEGGMGNAAPAPPIVNTPGGSIGRLPNGTDTNVNKSDWKVTTTITPDGVNQ